MQESLPEILFTPIETPVLDDFGDKGGWNIRFSLKVGNDGFQQREDVPKKLYEVARPLSIENHKFTASRIPAHPAIRFEGQTMTFACPLGEVGPS